MNAMKKINPSDLKKLLTDRVKNPKQYVDKPLVIWRSSYDSIQRRLLHEIFADLNKGKTDYDRKSFRMVYIHRHRDLFRWLVSSRVNPYDNEFGAPVRVYTGSREDIYYKLGLLVLDLALARVDYKRDPELLKNYYSLINDRKWDNITVCENVPVVAYMSLTDDWFETPEAYPKAEQYLFEPDFEAWADWAVREAGIPAYVIDFIRGDGDPAGIAHRWHPDAWVPHWNTFAKFMNEVKEDSHLEALMYTVFHGRLPKDVMDDFVEHLKNIL